MSVIDDEIIMVGRCRRLEVNALIFLIRLVEQIRIERYLCDTKLDNHKHKYESDYKTLPVVWKGTDVSSFGQSLIFYEYSININE